MLCKLIKETFDEEHSKDSSDSLDFKSLISNIVETINAHHSSEKREKLYYHDKTLVGLLQLCESIISARPELKDYLNEKYDFAYRIFATCLFDLKERDDHFKHLIGV